MFMDDEVILMMSANWSGAEIQGKMEMDVNATDLELKKSLEGLFDHLISAVCTAG